MPYSSAACRRRREIATPRRRNCALCSSRRFARATPAGRRLRCRAAGKPEIRINLPGRCDQRIGILLSVLLVHTAPVGASQGPPCFHRERGTPRGSGPGFRTSRSRYTPRLHVRQTMTSPGNVTCWNDVAVNGPPGFDPGSVGSEPGSHEAAAPPRRESRRAISACALPPFRNSI